MYTIDGREGDCEGFVLISAGSIEYHLILH
jgi:hypothetical protein